MGDLDRWVVFPTKKITTSGEQRIPGGPNWRPYSEEFNVSTGKMYTQSHPGFKKRLKGSTTDIGGPWYLRKMEANRYPGFFNDYLGLKGPWLSYTTAGNYTFMSPPTPVDFVTMNARGSSLISRAAPTNPGVDGAAFIGELISDIPRLPLMALKGVLHQLKHLAPDQRSALQTVKSLAGRSGDEYLNVVFGWLPMMRDLKQFFQVLGNASNIVKQFESQSGKLQRRTYGFPPTITKKSATVNGFCGYQYPVPCRIEIQETMTEFTWFTGAFRYYVPQGNSALDRFRRFESLANRLFGTRLTPSVMWELTPFSWGADWFGNMGDQMRNLSLFHADGLVMQYGYVMVSQTLEQIVTVYPQGGSKIAYHHVKNEVKQRRKASPYGFGLSDANLSNSQLAILAALGLSKGLRDDGLPSSQPAYNGSFQPL